MFRKSALKERLLRGETVYGPFVKSRCPIMCEVLGLAGFDFVIIDQEHGPHGVETVMDLVRTAENAGLAPIVRVGQNEETHILRPLDAGAHGILVPHVSSGEEAARVVEAAKFRPLGHRGMDIYARSARFGAIPKSEYFPEANREGLVMVQVEGLAGVEALPDLLPMEGIDVIFVGPYDLSQSMGIPGQVDDPRLVARVREIVTAIRGAGKAAGIYVDDAATAHRYAEMGVQFISILADVALLHFAAKNLVQELRG